MDRYRWLSLKDEIAFMARRAPSLDVGQIWQTVDVLREVYEINKIGVMDNGLVFDTTLNFEFFPDFPVYIKINCRNLIFKLNPGEFKVFGNQLLCGYPKEAKAIEGRDSPRLKMPEKPPIEITLRSVGQTTALDVPVILENISQKGIGIKVGGLNVDFFRRIKHFRLIYFSGLPVLEPAIFEVRQVTPKDNKQWFGVGMMASEVIGDNLHNLIKERIAATEKK